MNVRDVSGIDAIGAISVRSVSGLAAIGFGLIRDTDSLETFFSPAGGAFTVDVPPTAYGGAAANFPIAVTSESVTVTISGGRAPFTFAWERTDDILGDWSIINPASQSTAFRVAGLGPGVGDTAEFACTVTDANGTEVITGNVLVYAENYGGLGGPIP